MFSASFLFKVIFKNKASRPYSFHLHGVYDRSQGAGMAQTHSASAPPGVPGDPVAPGEARTYNWGITKKQGPTETEFACKTGAYYSTVDKVCIDLFYQYVSQLLMSEFVLFFCFVFNVCMCKWTVL